MNLRFTCWWMIAVALGGRVFPLVRKAQTGERASQESQARELASLQYETMLSAQGLPFGSRPALVVLQEMKVAHVGVPIWRARSSETSDLPPLIVAIVAGRAVGLGGFSSPDLYEVAEKMRATEPNLSPLEMGTALARLAAPVWSDDLTTAPQFAPLDSVSPPKSPVRIPREELVQKSNGGSMVCIGVSSAPAVEAESDPAVRRYCFRFRRNLELLAWFHT